MEEGAQVRRKGKSTYTQAAEKLVQTVGRGFIPGIMPIKSAVALATEVCFSDFLPEKKSFSAACTETKGAPGCRERLSRNKP
jgi:hypothetical protein